MEVKVFFPAYVHKNADSSYGVSFPDFPGCFSAADELSDLPKASQEAVELHFEGEGLQIPKPTATEKWAEDKRYQGGYWMLVDIDLSKVSSKAIRA
jgi:predicted RNase H-like HicB family nuclease